MGRGAYQHRTARQLGVLAALGAGLAATLAASLSSPGRAQQRAAAETLPTLPLSFAVAGVEGEPVVDEDWLDEQVDWANRIFAEPGVSFERVEVRALGAEHTRMETRRDRHRLGRAMQDDVINCFVVQSLRDVDDPSRMRMGVHWRPAGMPGRHFVIVSSTATPTVLTHELGHFFGNPHSDTVGNIMSYSRGEVVPFFDDGQVRRIRRFARRFLRTREIVPTS